MDSEKVTSILKHPENTTGQGELYYCINTFGISYDRWVSFRLSLKPHLLITLLTNMRMGSYIKPTYMCIYFNPIKQTKT